MLSLVESPSGKLTCPKCGYENDPQFRFCTGCGTELPLLTQSLDSSEVEPSGKPHGIEPDPDALYVEPRHVDGQAARDSGDETIDSDLPAYAVTDDKDKSAPGISDKSTPKNETNVVAIYMFVFLALLLPPIGVLVAILWILIPSCRKGVIPAVAASLIGFAVWGWIWWNGQQTSIYSEPHKLIQTYFTAQDRAHDVTGHYHSMMDLQINGFLPADFPPESEYEFTIIEHVLGPTGYIIEIRPAPEEAAILKMDSLWMDHTGDIRIGARDGPRFEP